MMFTFEGSTFERFQKFLSSCRRIYERLEVIGTKKTYSSMKSCTKEHSRRPRWVVLQVKPTRPLSQSLC